ncbi:hypothetical protein [Nonomuraea sp. SYSU D8015]|uniref:hypothetical protein n=1 Tax=Nonomuraea sp. SYSU D8015 TaxID=2593644 RepID=UPI00166183A9|nr:hypothetical protein [Nonomuraea sp. SYSU D8015]
MRTSFKTAEFGGQMNDRATRHSWCGATRHNAMRRGISLLGLVTAATVAFATVTPAPAGATVSRACAYRGCSGIWGTGSGEWIADGDKMLICDGYADGYSVVVRTDIGRTSQPNKWHTSGAGKCTERSYGDVAEGQNVAFYTCLGKKSTNYILPGSCGQVGHGTT